MSTKSSEFKGMEGSQLVWIADQTHGFILGNITDIGSDGVTVVPLQKGLKPVHCDYDRVFPAEEDTNKDVDDNCALMYLNEATLLNNIKTRYQRDKIYTYVANILIAVNPYFEIRNLYSLDTIKKYQGKSLGQMPPHVFALADKAFRDMKVLKQSQSIIVSGESGAGKTESTKYILRYLCESWGSKMGELEQKILDANPVLEAFGNAKTTRNNNSSRFGKFIEIHFNERFSVVGGFISHYLLEKSRIVLQGPQERNYHIFYQLCAGAPDQLKQKLRLGNPDQFNYLKRGCTQFFCNKTTEKHLSEDRKSQAQKRKGPLRDPMLDDVNDFSAVDKALSNLGIDPQDRLAIYTTVAAVLHLGNIFFEDNLDDVKGGCMVSPGCEQSLSIAADLMGVDPEELNQALLARVMQTSKGGLKGTVIMVPLKVHEANGARDALAKALYSKLFDYIVHRINESIPFFSSSYYIGVLDIAGFEYFPVNSFEQFCINYCNEKLQQFFNERILKEEQALYEKEGLGVKKISYSDNQDCIDLIEMKGAGIIALLDEESKLPKPSHTHFTSAVHGNHGNHFRLALPRKSKLRDHREIRDDEGFLIRHFAGAVCYQTEQFLGKNNDALHASLEALVQESEEKFIQNLFTNNSEVKQPTRGKLTFISIASKFKTHLQELMDKLASTGTNFIRCIKPNVKMVDHEFEGGAILSQLQCSGMTSVLELMHQGYPSRAPFHDLYNMYKSFLPQQLSRLDPRLFCKALFKALGLDEKDFKFGLTKVFFRPGKFAEFDQIMKSDPENLKILVAKVKKWLLQSRWKKAQWCTLSVIKLKNKILYRREQIVIIQKNIRMYNARKRYAPKYKGIIQIKGLQGQLKLISDIIGQLKKDKESSVSEAKKLQKALNDAIIKIKTTNLTRDQIEREYKTLVAAINCQLATLKKKLESQKVAEEQERLKKIQEEMERVKKKKEDEERKLKEEEEKRKKRLEIEMRRRAEEEERKRQEEIDRKAAFVLQAQMEKEMEESRRLAEQEEQERRDHELALRLSSETHSGVDDLIPSLKSAINGEPGGIPLKRSQLVEQQRAAAANKKFDLSKWKYAELRDTINTSCDLELLEACREEFHRRLKVYHSWKAKNKKTTMEENQRAPKSILDAAVEDGGMPCRIIGVKAKNTPARVGPKQPLPPGNKNSHRYFRIPFVRPTDQHRGDSQQERGWWYAHFEGEWIARQMELHPNKAPIVLVAGMDDMQMCELSLEETGLTRKRGAEILEHEFEREWQRHGGRPFHLKNGHPNVVAVTSRR